MILPMELMGTQGKEMDASAKNSKKKDINGRYFRFLLTTSYAQIGTPRGKPNSPPFLKQRVALISV
jgi:hypothetical protein